MLACEYSRVSSLHAAGVVSRRDSTAIYTRENKTRLT